MSIISKIIQPRSKWPDFKVCAQAFMLYIQSFSTCFFEFKSRIISYKAVATSGLNVLISKPLTWLAFLPELEVNAWCSWKAARPGLAMASTEHLEVCLPWTCALFRRWSDACELRRCPSESQSTSISLCRRPEVCEESDAESCRTPRGQCLPP